MVMVILEKNKNISKFRMCLILKHSVGSTEIEYMDIDFL